MQKSNDRELQATISTPSELDGSIKPITPISLEKVELLQNIIEQVEKGEIELSKECHHAINRHSLAGWVEVRVLEERGDRGHFDPTGNYTPEDYNDAVYVYDKSRFYFRSFSPLTAEYRDFCEEAIEIFAANYLGLNPDEAYILFSPKAPIDYLKELIRGFSLGYRLLITNDGQTCSFDSLSNNLVITTFDDFDIREQICICQSDLINFMQPIDTSRMQF